MDTTQYKSKLEDMLKEIETQLEELAKSDPSEAGERSVHNETEDRYMETERGFRVNEIIEDLNYKKGEIIHALEKIDNGTYGFCEETNEKISEDRLKAVPYARYCVNHQDDTATEPVS